ncbi:MAG TPA: 30S ribosomal protein S5 [Candidatus Paceibacterota bacterium]
MDQRNNRNRNDRRDRSHSYRVKEEFKEQVLELRRVTRVVAGGKRFRFRATIVIGDEAGRVAVGVSKGLDVQSSIAKAKSAAKKAVFRVPLQGRTIPHEVFAKYSAAKVLIKPALEGSGLKAGGAVRVVLNLAGIKDATAKCLGRTTNKLTNAMAAIEALKDLRPRKVKTPKPSEGEKVNNGGSEEVLKTDVIKENLSQ